MESITRGLAAQPETAAATLGAAALSAQDAWADAAAGETADENTANTVADETAVNNTETVVEETTEDTEQEEDMTEELATILKQISSEISSLKDEINNLKSEVEAIKGQQQDSHADSEELEIVPESTDQDAGFFADDENAEDATLSGNELSNILNSADVTTQEESPAEADSTSAAEPAAAEESTAEAEPAPAAEADETVQEEVPAESESEAQDESINADIPVPTDQSSEEGFFGGDENAEDATLSINELTNILDTAEVTAEEQPAAAAEEGEAQPERSAAPESEAEEAESSSDAVENLSAPIKLFDESSEEEPLTEDNLNYLESDENAGKEEEEVLETGISEEPVEQVFNEWAPGEAEAESQETEAAGDAAAETESVPAAESTESDASGSESPAESSAAAAIPADMKEEIKSVLSYMDQLLESLPEEKIAEFAKSEEFNTYKKLFNELGLA